MDQIPPAESDLEEYSPISRNRTYVQECEDDLPEFSPLDSFSCAQVVGNLNQEIDLSTEGPLDCFDAVDVRDSESLLQAEPPPLDPIQSRVLDICSQSKEMMTRFLAQRAELTSLQSGIQTLVSILAKLREEKTNAEFELTQKKRSRKERIDALSRDLEAAQANYQLQERENRTQSIETEIALSQARETASKAETISLDLQQDFARIKELNERVERIEARIQKVMSAPRSSLFTWTQIRRKHVCRVFLFLLGVLMGYVVKKLWRCFSR